MPKIRIIKPPLSVLLAPVQFACVYTCACGTVVNYYDENGKPKRLIKCWECVADETK